MKKLSEFDIIGKFFKPLTNQSKQALQVSQNLSDDVARISLKKDEELIVSQDIMVEDIHFLMSDGAYNIAAKLLLSNLSDIASSGSKPIFYMLGFSKNENIDEKFLQDFSQGLKTIQDEFNISLIGGDTVKSSSKLFFSITIFAIAKKNKLLLRKNAKNNDLIFVSGDIGNAYVGRQILNGNLKIKNQEKFINKHLLPKPQIKLGQELIAQNLSACAIDISDGLLADLKHICDSSKLSAIIFSNQIPIDEEIRKENNLNLLDLISAGDDYELIFSAKKNNEEKILQLAKKLKVKITKIGYFKNDSDLDITLLDSNNKKINFSKYGYEH